MIVELEAALGASLIMVLRSPTLHTTVFKPKSWLQSGVAATACELNVHLEGHCEGGATVKAGPR